MDIDNIRAFVTVAELKSLSAAASRMNHLQSNMTAKIKKLEAHYRQQLFIRSARGMELTEEGIKLYRQYKKLLVLWEETEQAMNRREAKLRLGTMQSVISGEITLALTNLYEKYPDLSVTLKTGTTEKMEQELIQGNIDLAYTIGKTASSQLTYRKIGTEELVLIGRKAAEGASLEYCLQKENRIILSEDCLYTSILEQLYSVYGFQKGNAIEVGVLETLLQFARLGMGISVISKRIAQQYKLNHFVQLPPEYRYIDKYIVTRLNYELSPLERQFIETSHFL
ncbi:DNA-binding transcriptional regulator, LysR family [Paenibacillus sophorae]|uniref:DNA-binding transcriptional regulator, LysR family n=1 Tax=Paenibacillus sophorae TaxID=1333845 RepID=A0A1H8PI67_9BACL|nr:LysR family transcriptional regulator [Paenibacillus sophorae]QWU16581.1 LysR family transcriptional regulator [Paenibacillus sophorae]SEO41461.1 DNA-binding transcriptional regulator, LysR family [Paenibacillus sophorae]